MIDIGANLADRDFDGDRQDVLRRAMAAGVTTIIVTGTCIASSRTAVDLAWRLEDHVATGPELETSIPLPRLYATAGVHPHQSATVGPRWREEVTAFAQAAEVVAIGETGLDYFRDMSPRADQRRIFRRQIELAVETGKPLFVHDRDSNGDTRSILADYRHGLTDCVIHCFTGTAADLDGYLEDDYHIGITGWICDERRGRDLFELVKRIPAKRLLIETDSPYLLPRTMNPKPRSRRNEPAFLPWVARRVAECRGQEPAAIERLTHDNAVRFFRLPKS